MSTKAQRARADRRAAGLTNGGRNLWIDDHDGAPEVYAVEVEGDVVRLVNEDAVEYTVSRAGCSCPAGAYRKRGTFCKHQRRCMEAGLLPSLAASSLTCWKGGVGGG